MRSLKGGLTISCNWRGIHRLSVAALMICSLTIWGAPLTSALGIVGDINESGRVDGYDLWIFSEARDTVVGDPTYNPLADANNDGAVDDADLEIITASFGFTGRGLYLWVGDYNNDQIVKLLLSDGEQLIRDALCDGPVAVSVNNTDGTVWVACHNVHQVKKLNQNGQVLATISGFNYPRALDVNEATGEVWIADRNNNVVVKLDPNVPNNYNVNTSTGYHAKVLGFNYVCDVSVNMKTGVVWVADTNNNRVTKLSPGIPNGYNVNSSTGYHLHKTGFGYPQGVSVNISDGTCWVASTSQDQVVKLSPSGTIEMVRRSGFNDPIDISVNSIDGTAWIADYYNNRIVKLDSSGNVVGTIGGMAYPISVSVDPQDGSCWVADNNNGKVVKIIVSGMETIRKSGFYNPHAVEVYSAQKNPTAPTALAEVHPLQAQAEQVISFDGTGTDPDGEVVLYEWDFDGDGEYEWSSTETGKTTHAYQENGLFTPSFRVTDNTYQQHIDYHNLVRIGVLEAYADAAPLSGYAPVTVTFTASYFDPVDGQVISYQWDFDGDGFYDSYQNATSNPMTIQYTYPKFGSFDAVLKVSDTGNVIATDTVAILIKKSDPTVTALVSPPTGLAPLTVTLTAQATDPDGAIIFYEWDFENDGVYDWFSPSSGVVSHTYPLAIDYTAKTRVTDNDGLTATSTVLIRVQSAAPTATASAVPLKGNVPLTVAFTGTATDPDGSVVLYQWDFDGNGTYDWSNLTHGNTSHTYATPGIYNAVFRVIDNTGDTAQDVVLINAQANGMPIAVADVDFSETYINDEITLIGEDSTDPDGSLVLFEWDTQTKPIFEDDMETDSSKWTYNGSWARTTESYHSQTTSWTDSPLVNYSNSLDSSLYSMSLSLPDATQTYLRFWHRYQTQYQNDYCYVYISTNGGSNWTELRNYSGTQSVWVQEQLDISAYDNKTNVKIRFRLNTNASLNYDGWYVDDVEIVQNMVTEHQSETEPNWVTTFTQPGDYQAMLKVTDNNGNTDTDTVWISVDSGLPIAIGEADPEAGLAPLLVDLIGENSYDINGSLVLYEWDYIYYYFFDDMEGSLYRWATIQSPWGLTTDAHSGLYAWTESPSGNYPNYLDTYITTRSFSLGDATAPQLNFWYKLNASTSYNYNDCGRVEISTDSGTTWTQVARYDAYSNTSSWVEADIDLTAYAGLTDVKLRFRFYSDSYYTGDGWIIDDITVGEGFVADYSSPDTANTSYTYDPAGYYIAALRVTDDDGQQAMILVPIHPEQAPEATVHTPKADEVLRRGYVSFYGTGWDYDGDVELYEWDFDGDGTYDASSFVSGSGVYQFTEPGIWTASFRVTDDDGITDVATVTFSIESFSPTITAFTASPTEANLPVTVNFTVTASDYDGTIDNYNWDWDGDGTYDQTTTINNPTKYYTEAGEYAVMVQVVDNEGNTAEATVNLTLKPQNYPTANGYAIPTHASAGQLINFYGSGSDNGTIVAYEWDFDGDGVYDWSGTGNGNTTYAYAESGIYQALFRVTDNDGKQDTDPETLYVDYTGGKDSVICLSNHGNERVYKYQGGVYKWYTATGMLNPMGLSVDPSDGSIWVANYDANKVTKLDANGATLLDLTTVNRPYSTAVIHANGSCWVSSRYGHQVVLYASDGTEVRRLSGFNEPLGIDVDQTDGSVWVADHVNDDVVKISIDGAVLFRMEAFDNPVWLSVDQDTGNCWVADRDRDNLVLVDKDTPTEIIRITGFLYPNKTITGPDSSAWVCDTERDRIYRVAADGTFLNETYSPNPYSVAFDPSTYLTWAVDWDTDTMTVMSLNGTKLMTFTGFSDPHTIIVSPGFTAADDPPTASATADVVMGDTPLTVNFTGTGTDNSAVVAYQWDFEGDGVWDFTSDVSGDTSFTFTAPKIYNPIFRTVDDEGYYGFDSSIIIRAGDIYAWASATPLTGNANLSVSLSGGGFTPFGDGRLYKYEWDYEGDGVFDWSSTSTASVSRTYSYGNYVPVLRITDQLGNTALASPEPIRVTSRAPTAVIYVSTSSGSNPLTLRMHGNSSSDPDGSIAFWEWDFNGDGTYDYGSASTSDIYYTYYTDGVFLLTLRVTDNHGNQATASTTITVGNASPIADGNASPLEGNVPFTVNFTGTGTDRDGEVVLYQWDFGEGTFIDDMEHGSGLWTAAAPWALITSDYHSRVKSWTDSPGGNYGSNVNAALTSTGFSIPADANPSLRFWHKYQTETCCDKCYVEISTDNGSTWTMLARYEGTLTTWTQATIDLNAYSGSSSTKIRFRLQSDVSINYDGWYIDDVAVTALVYEFSSTENGTASHTYQYPGWYRTTFKVTDDDGASGTDEVFVEVKSNGAPTATAAGSPTSGAVPLIVNFTGTGSDPDGTVELYEWDFDGDEVWDWSSTTTGSVSYTYPAGGIFNAILRVTDNDGQSDEDQITINVGIPTSRPYAYPHTGNAPLAVQFIANGYDPDGTIEYYRWDFDGNGTIDREERVSAAYTYTYNSAGVYYPTLTVVDNQGFSHTASLTITVITSYAPTASATVSPDTGAPPLTVTFSGYGIDWDGTIALFEWDFDGDGTFDYTSTTSGNTQHNYQTVGDYQAAFRVTDNDGLTGTKELWINVNPSGSPTALASGTPLSGSTPFNVTFTGSGTDDDGVIVLYEWDFDGDGAYDWSSATTGTKIWNYTTPGFFEAVLRVTDDAGLTDTARLNIDAGMGISAQRSVEAFDPTIDETVAIQTTLAGTSEITIRLFNRDVQHVRTLVDHVVREPGYYMDVWDGKDDEGVIVTSGVYFFVIDYSIDGRDYTWDITGTSGSQVFPTVSYSSSFNPLDDVYLTATFTLSAPAEVTTYISPFSSSAGLRVRTMHLRQPMKSGPKVIVWDGTKDDGTIAPLDQSYVVAVMMWALSNNAIIVASDPWVKDVAVEPNFYTPKNPYQLDPNAHCMFSYSLSKECDITVSFRNSSNYLINEFVIPDVQPGINYFYWDGSYFGTRFGAPGLYQARIEAVDNFGNHSERIHGLLRIFY